MCHLQKFALDLASLAVLHYFCTSISEKPYPPVWSKARKNTRFTPNLASFSKGITVWSNHGVTVSFATNLHFHFMSSALQLHGHSRCTGRTFLRPLHSFSEKLEESTHIYTHLSTINMHLKTTNTFLWALTQENNKDLIVLINHRMTISQQHDIGIENVNIYTVWQLVLVIPHLKFCREFTINCNCNGNKLREGLLYT